MTSDGFAPCPSDRTPGTAPRRAVRVRIDSVRLNTDMEGDDDYVPFYDNRADIYGRVTIEGQEFQLPEVTDSNFPHWDPEAATFVADVTVNPVPIHIQLQEADSGLTGEDDEVDINPSAGKTSLDLLFDTCSLMIRGDLPGTHSQATIESAGQGDAGGRIRFSIENAEGPPGAQDDIALVEVDLVQVVHRPSRLVAGKPTIVMVRVSNSSDHSVNTNLRLRISGSSVDVNETFPLELPESSLSKFYLMVDEPLVFPPAPETYTVTVAVSVDDAFSKGLPQNDCHRVNDLFDKADPLRVITTAPLNLMWAKVGSGLDIGNYTPEEHFNEIRELGRAYVEGTYPASRINWSVSPFPLSPPLNVVHDWMSAILSFLPYARSLDPFALIFELNLLSVVSGSDNRILGVLPSHDWFVRYDGWEGTTGCSMGEFAPHAVIMLARHGDDGAAPRPQMTLPAHELGHTFGLSIDPRLKESWVCDVDWPVVGSLPCGARGGLDEYKHNDALLKRGNPASGFWIRQGSEPAALDLLVNQEQCNSHCFMGGSPSDAHLSWGSSKHWIDRADYEQLLDKLQGGGSSLLAELTDNSMFVSGLIAWNDQAYLGEAFVVGSTSVPDHAALPGLYGVRLLDDAGKSLVEVGLPIRWGGSDYPKPFPITPFSLTIPFSSKTRALEVVNRGTGKRLARRRIRRSGALVRLTHPASKSRVRRGEILTVRWEVDGGRKKKPRTVVLVSPDDETWWPASVSAASQSYVLDTGLLEAGTYLVKVAVIEGADLIKSEPIHLQVVP